MSVPIINKEPGYDVWLVLCPVLSQDENGFLYADEDNGVRLFSIHRTIPKAESALEEAWQNFLDWHHSVDFSVRIFEGEAVDLAEIFDRNLDEKWQVEWKRGEPISFTAALNEIFPDLSREERILAYEFLEVGPFILNGEFEVRY
jgi:hypothetical protein